jgi:hypothetical protein
MHILRKVLPAIRHRQSEPHKTLAHTSLSSNRKLRSYLSIRLVKLAYIDT